MAFDHLTVGVQREVNRFSDYFPGELHATGVIRVQDGHAMLAGRVGYDGAETGHLLQCMGDFRTSALAAHTRNYRDVGAVVAQARAENTFVTGFHYGGVNRRIS